MSRDITDDTYYISKAKKIPIKWTAPEVSSFFKFTVMNGGTRHVGTLIPLGIALQEILYSQ